MARTTTVYLLSGDYAERLDALYEQAQAALNADPEEGSSQTLVEGDAYTTLLEEYRALKAEAEAAGIRVVLSAIGRKEYRALRDKHPPREGDDVDEETAKSDRLAGVNTDSIEDDLVYASLVEPEFKSRAAYDEWVDELSEAEFQTILGRAWVLTNVARIDPKSLPDSPTRTSVT